ncbi:DUF2700 domain-containing protein [Caenorhabditis elegans]|uniref:Transmembrane protein n=1 Tax=Caenorhabditis elegans TaxID=6239 RepID=Q20526_CAEEL|nr:Transmembrane protein [Caenorhabditis elegans]CAB01201.1 Transmembrane protein [Caenorhabditis elegans]|eukprot:NP_506547.1 Uncharacterized protein CELE_F47B8.1 [Caenorhabditis elegans]
MDYSNIPPLGLESPKLCCIPARPLVCVLSVLTIVSRIANMSKSTDVSRVFDSFFLFLNLLLLFGAVWNNEPALIWSQRIIAVVVVLVVIQFMIWPVLFASLAASGRLKLENVLSKTEYEKEEMFQKGLLAGYVAEFVLVLAVGVEILKYVLINRLWKYAKSTENVVGNVYITA